MNDGLSSVGLRRAGRVPLLIGRSAACLPSFLPRHASLNQSTVNSLTIRDHRPKP